jgi:hypothetical protein
MGENLPAVLSKAHKGVVKMPARSFLRHSCIKLRVDQGRDEVDVD